MRHIGNTVGAGWCRCEAVFSSLLKDFINVGGCWWPEEGEYRIQLQEGQGAGYQEWRGSQPNLSLHEDDGMNPPESHIQAREEQGDGEASMDLARTNYAWLTRQLLIRWLIQWMRGGQWILVFLNFCEAFHVVSHGILVGRVQWVACY